MEHFPWFPVYRTVLLETDSSKLPEEILLARKTLTARLQAISQDSNAEQQAIIAALNALFALESSVMTRKQQAT